jgi:excisionase family DNA binding protein
VIHERFSGHRRAEGPIVAEHAFTIAEFSEAFKVGRTTAYEEIAAGRLATYKVGRRRYISAHAAAEWQSRLEAETPRPLAPGPFETGARHAAEGLGCRLVADLEPEELAAWMAAGQPRRTMLGGIELVPAKTVRRLVARKPASKEAA